MPQTPRLSAFVLTRNESRNITRCLDALAFCDEIVVVDAESEDDTVALARPQATRVRVEPWRGFAAQRRLAVAECRGDWVLWVDADEVVGPELAASIRAVVAEDRLDPASPAAFRIRRRVHYLGAWIRFGGWGSDWVVRLFRRDRVRFPERAVHESAEVDGPVGRLAGLLDHHSYRDLEHHWKKLGVWSTLAARQARAEGRTSRWWDLVFRPPARWGKIYLLRLGFLDGWRGWIVAGMAAIYVFCKYAKLRELERTGRTEADETEAKA